MVGGLSLVRNSVGSGMLYISYPNFYLLRSLSKNILYKAKAIKLLM